MARPVYLAGRFPRTWTTLSAAQREHALDIILALPELMKDAPKHSGFGFRRLHGSAFYEARLDLRWRLVMRIDSKEILLFDVLNHDQVRRLSR